MQRHFLLGDFADAVLVLRIGDGFIGRLPLERPAESRRRLNFPDASLKLLVGANIRKQRLAVGRMRADESSAAGDEDSHTTSPREPSMRAFRPWATMWAMDRCRSSITP